MTVAAMRETAGGPKGSATTDSELSPVEWGGAGRVHPGVVTEWAQGYNFLLLHPGDISGRKLGSLRSVAYSPGLQE